MEILRQPIEDGKVTISRVHGTVSYPCSIMLVAAMNPCPCGYFGHPTKPCTCSSKTVSHYLSRVSGPLLDRLDLHVEVPAVDFDDLSSEQAESSEKSNVGWIPPGKFKTNGFAAPALPAMPESRRIVCRKSVIYTHPLTNF